jgi:hypothetical protein
MSWPGFIRSTVAHDLSMCILRRLTKRVSPVSCDPSALRRLKQGLARAKADRDAPLAEGEIREALPLDAYFDGKAKKAKWRVVSEIRVKEKDLYNRFGNDPFLAGQIVELLEESDDDLNWTGLLKGLENFLKESSEWIVAIPLANALTKGYTQITDRVGLAEVLQDPNWERNSESPVSSMEIFEHLDDYLDLGARWHRKDTRTGPLDARRTAALIFVEKAAEPLALSVARTKARYAIAMWCLLAAPEWHHLWPTLADWEPRAYIERPIKRKKYERANWAGVRSRVKGGGMFHYQEYELPRKPEVLEAPFRALERARDNSLPARAALSASWSLYLAERVPGDLERTDRLMLVFAALDALCDIGEGPTDDVDNRWGRFAERHGIWREMKDAYSQKDIKDAKVLVRDLRNIATHGSDDVLLNLGYPPEQIRKFRGGRERTGVELSLAEAATSFPVLATAAHLAARRIASQGVKSDWDDGLFLANFDL